MPVKVQKRGKLYRLVELSGRIARSRKGRAVDGGGHSSRTRAVAQARAINRKKS